MVWTEEDKKELNEIRDILKDSLNYLCVQVSRPKVKSAIEKLDKILDD